MGIELPTFCVIEQSHRDLFGFGVQLPGDSASECGTRKVACFRLVELDLDGFCHALGGLGLSTSMS